MAKRFLSLNLLLVFAVAPVVTVYADVNHGDQGANGEQVLKELQEAGTVDQSGKRPSKINLLERSSKFFVPLAITAQQQDAQVVAREAKVREVINASVGLLLQESGSSSSQWKVEEMFREFTQEERNLMHAQVAVELAKIAEAVAQDNAQKLVARSANSNDAVQSGKHVAEITAVKNMVESGRSFFVNGPAGKDYVYDQLCRNKVAAVAVVTAVVTGGFAAYYYVSAAGVALIASKLERLTTAINAEDANIEKVRTALRELNALKEESA